MVHISLEVDFCFFMLLPPLIMDPLFLCDEIDRRNNDNKDHQHDRLCARVAELVIAERILEYLDDERRVLYGDVSVCHDVNGREYLEDRNKLHDDQIKGRRRNELERNLPELFPRRHTIQLCSLIQVTRNILKRRHIDDQLKAELHPDNKDYDWDLIQL